MVPSVFYETAFWPGGGLILAAMIAKAHVQGEPVDVGDNEPTKEGLLAKSLFTKQWLPRVQSQIQ